MQNNGEASSILTALQALTKPSESPKLFRTADGEGEDAKQWPRHELKGDDQHTLNAVWRDKKKESTSCLRAEEGHIFNQLLARS